MLQVGRIEKVSAKRMGRMYIDEPRTGKKKRATITGCPIQLTLSTQR